MGKSALIIIDVQNDFLPGGALAVPNGDKVIPEIKKIIKTNNFDFTIMTKDFHPKDHISFYTNHEGKFFGDLIETEYGNQVLWPEHCIADEHGSFAAETLLDVLINKKIYKGQRSDVDSYSAFFDNFKIEATELDKYLKENEITDIYLTGLATEYCVYYTAIDGINLGYNVFLFKDAVQAVNIKPNDGSDAIEGMKVLGVKVI